MDREAIIANSLVRISSEGKLKGIGFIVESSKKDDYSYVLTCNHVVYNDGKFRPKITVDGKEIDNEDIELGLDQTFKADMALIKILQLDKVSISLQPTITNKKLKIHTFKIAKDNDKLSTHSDTIDVTLENDEILLGYDNNNAIGYKFLSTVEIKSGYSGSPIIEKDKVVAILNIAEDEIIAKALAIENIYKVFTDYFTKPNIHQESKILSLCFKKQNGVYVITINNNPIEQFFSFEQLSQEDNIKIIINKIKEKVTLSTETLEIFLMPELFTLGINEWQYYTKIKLSQKFRILFRSVLLKDSKGDFLEHWKTRWEEHWEEYACQSFKATMCNIKDDDCLDSSIISAIFNKETLDESDFEFLIAEYISIAIWKRNFSHETERYVEFLNKFEQHNFEIIPKNFQSCVKEFPRDIALMWDDPTTLPKKDFQ